MLAFPNRIVFIGFGSVARCTLPILLEHVAIPPHRVTIIDFAPDERLLAPWLARGVNFVLDRILAERLSAGDLLVDLAWNIDTAALLDWCHGRGVMYVNTAVELRRPRGKVVRRVEGAV